MNSLNKMTIASLLENSFYQYASLNAVSTWRHDNSTLTYAELYRGAETLALYFVGYKLNKGDKVAIISEGCTEWALSYFAINMAGLIAVPVLPDFSKEEIEGIITHSGARLIIVNEKHAPKIEAFTNDPQIRILKTEDILPLVFPHKNGSEQTSACRKNKENTLAEKTILDERQPDEDDITSIIYTSGTTGTPKAVMLTNKNIVWNAIESSTPIVKIKPSWRTLSILPLSHVYEFTLGMIVPLMYGAHITYLYKAPSPDTLMPALAEVRPHIVLSVPLLIEKIYRRLKKTTLKEGSKIAKLAENRFLSPFIYKRIGKKLIQTFGGHLKFFGVGGAPFDREAEEFFHKAHFPYALGYGLTETSPFIAGCGPKDQVLGTLGPVIQGLDVKISPENGEILVKGPSVMKGYYKNEDLNKESFTEDGYFKTGDIGEFSVNKGKSRKQNPKRLAIKGRCKTMILSSTGENIYPESIEFFLNAEDSVLESLIIPDGSSLKALVRLDLKDLKRKGEITVESIAEALERIRINVNKRLSSFSKIQKIEMQEEPFERTPTNKIKRFLYPKKNKPASNR